MNRETKRACECSAEQQLLALNISEDYKTTEKTRLFWERIRAGSEPETLEALLAGVGRSCLAEAGRQITEARRLGVRLLTPDSAEYPPELARIPDAPLMLFLRGNLQSRCSVAIVGARRCSGYGSRTAARLGRAAAAAGATVVSGLALGVDAAAHRGALEAWRSGGTDERHAPTIAVLGSGVCSIHPRSNAQLADEILAAGGAVLSEYGLFEKPRRYYYPRRNRIISGLSKRVVVVEADERSGSLITARCALEQNKEVAAVPGALESIVSRGSNRLLQDGAQVICDYTDVTAGIAELGGRQGPTAADRDAEAERRLVELALDEQAQRAAGQLLCELGAVGGLTFEQIRAKSELDGSRLRVLLGRLELAGLVLLREGSYALGEAIDNC